MLQMRRRATPSAHRRHRRGPIVVRPGERVTILPPEPHATEVRVSVTEADSQAQTGPNLCDQLRGDPVRLARAVAKHYARHFLGSFAEPRSASCDNEGRECRVKLASGIVIQVVLSHMPEYVSAQMVLPSKAQPVEFDYHCDAKGLRLVRKK